MRDLYEVMGVPPSADAATIKSRYRQLARQLHPDLTGGDPAREKKFKEVAAAYSVLGNEELRKRYDLERSRPRSTAANHGGMRGFGEQFDDLVDRIAREGVNPKNTKELWDNFFDVAGAFHDRAMTDVKEAARNPHQVASFLENIGIPSELTIGVSKLFGKK